MRVPRAVVGLVLGLVTAVAPSCASPLVPCNLSTCADGCCDDHQVCRPGTAAAACGTLANACTSCGLMEACTQGACALLPGTSSNFCIAPSSGSTVSAPDNDTDQFCGTGGITCGTCQQARGEHCVNSSCVLLGTDGGAPDAGGPSDAGPLGFVIPCQYGSCDFSSFHDLSSPLHPELNRDCARTEEWKLGNQGNAGLPVAASVDGAGFSLRPGPCNDGMLSLQQSCIVGVCFSSPIPGVYLGRLQLGGLVVPLSATVLPETAGLDRTFNATGGLAFDEALDEFIRRPLHDVAGTPDAVLFWHWGGYSVEKVSRDGGSQAFSGLIPPSPDYLVTEFRTARWTRDAGLFVIGGNGGNTNNHALVNWAPDGTVSAVPLYPSMYPRAALAQLSSGRLLAIGQYGLEVGTEIQAFTPAMLDTTYGTQGFFDLPTSDFLGTAVTDPLDRTSLITSTGVVRLLAGGGVDPQFQSSRAVDALAVLDGGRLLAVADGGLLVLDEFGVATALAPADAGPNLGVAKAVQLDGLGRIHVVDSQGRSQRYAADGTWLGQEGFEGVIGLACFADGACALVGATNCEEYVVMLQP